MSTNKKVAAPSATSPMPKAKQSGSRLRLRTLIEILPILIALTIFFSYTTIKGVSTVQLVTPLNTILDAVPMWVALLMLLITIVGVSGMVWLIYIFSKAALRPDVD